MIPTQNNKVTYLVGIALPKSRPLVPYDSTVCEFLNDLSKQLRKHREGTVYPDIVTFGFWCRKANLAQLKASFDNGLSRLGRGLVFHITPSNVPINFAYSFAFGLLSGNANLVRVPSRPFPQVDLICAAINRLFEESKYDEIKAMTTFVRYEQNAEITASFSANCDARIIWGGDVAIRNVRKLPIAEHGVEIAFADRYSFCMIDSASIASLGEKELKRLAENFYNDTYLMDQNACSSPHLVIWVGQNNEKAKERFWNAVKRVVTQKYKIDFVKAVDKYTLFCKDSMELENIQRFTTHDNSVSRMTIDSLSMNTDQLRGKFGYFYEYDTNDIESITEIINAKYQTLTYFGLEKSQLIEYVVKNRLPGIDRIVPIGKALDIGMVWDGYDVAGSLSRVIDVH